jgi:hypothetical protein
MNASDLPRTTAAAAATLRVRALTAGDEAAWADYVGRHPQATFFHRIGWRHLLSDEMRHRTHYLIAERGGVLAGVLPLAEVRSRLFGHALSSLPFAVYGGALGDDGGVVRTLDEAALSLARRLDVQHLELRNRAAAHPD